MKNLTVLAVAALSILAAGCTIQKSTRLGPDPYNIECINGEVWIGSEHGKSKLGSKCDEGK